MNPYLHEEYGNPSTLYSLARDPRRAVESARETVAGALNAAPEEITFTSGGTESDNWALVSTALEHMGKHKRIITSCIEHHAVLNTCGYLEKLGFEVVYLPVSPDGIVSRDALKRAINADTILISIMMANNEIGTIEPVMELASIAHEHDVLFHTDAVQAIGHIPVDVKALGIDLLSASAHKFNGPKGVGFLYHKQGVELEPLLHGGGQEHRLRSGTENVAGIVGTAIALQESTEMIASESHRLEALRGRLIKRLSDKAVDYRINGSNGHIPGSLSISFRGISGEAILHRMDLMGISIATGSACNSKESVLSHVIRAIRVPDEYSGGTVRITLGKENTEEDVDRIAASLVRITFR